MYSRANVFSDMFCKLLWSVKTSIALFQAGRYCDTVNICCEASFP